MHHFLLGTLSRDEYIAEFVYNYGEWRRDLGEELWRGRARSAFDPRYFEYPMLRRIAASARAVIVHNPGRGGDGARSRRGECACHPAFLPARGAGGCVRCRALPREDRRFAWNDAFRVIRLSARAEARTANHQGVQKAACRAARHGAAARGPAGLGRSRAAAAIRSRPSGHPAARPFERA